MSATTTTTTSSLASLKLQNNRSQTSALRRFCLLKISDIKHGFCFAAIQRLYYSTNRRERSKYSINAINNVASGPPVPPAGSGWSGWMLLLLLPVIVPLFQSKSGFLSLKKKLVSVIQTIASISEVVEDVARRVDHIADHAVAKLPEGQLKEAISKFDEVAEGVIKAADLVQEMAEKVDRVEKEVNDLVEQVEVEKQAAANLNDKQIKDHVEAQANEENLENKPMNQVDNAPKPPETISTDVPGQPK